MTMSSGEKLLVGGAMPPQPPIEGGFIPDEIQPGEAQPTPGKMIIDQVVDVDKTDIAFDAVGYEYGRTDTKTPPRTGLSGPVTYAGGAWAVGQVYAPAPDPKDAPKPIWTAQQLADAF
jgi:hypothetical protein